MYSFIVNVKTINRDLSNTTLSLTYTMNNKRVDSVQRIVKQRLRKMNIPKGTAFVDITVSCMNSFNKRYEIFNHKIYDTYDPISI